MKLSRFNCWVKDYPAPGNSLLFNTRTQALLKLDKAFQQELFSSVESASLSLRIKDSFTALKKNGVIIEDEREEEEKLTDFFRQLKYECGSLTFEATILTTYNCNFRCVYCFENSVRSNDSLDEETSAQIVKWLCRHIKERKVKKVCLVYYGGEPMLNTQPIYSISKSMQEWAEGEGIGFGFVIITNGSLLQPDVIGMLTRLGLKEVRVTLDGDKGTHDRMRPFSDGTGSFDVIIRNIKNILGRVNVTIAGNFTPGTFEGIRRLIDYLQEEGMLKQLSSIGFAPVVPRLGPQKNPGAMEMLECAQYVSDEELFYKTAQIKRELLGLGISIDTGLAINTCSLFMRDAGVTIDPKGMIYKCNSLLGYPEFAVGDVRSEGFNSTMDFFSNIDAWKKCPPGCPYVPMCQGGCRFFSFIEHGNFEGLACRREYLDRIMPELIKLEYEKLSCRPAASHA